MSARKPGLSGLTVEDLKQVLGASSGPGQALVRQQLEEATRLGRRGGAATGVRARPPRPPAAAFEQSQPRARAAPAPRQSPRPPSDEAPRLEQLAGLIDLHARALLSDAEFCALKSRRPR